MNYTPTEEIARKVLCAVRPGLVEGIGMPEPGKMCVEAAVNYAFGLPHSDHPPCVGREVRRAKIALNDQPWKDNVTRAKALEKVALAQLGSDQINQQEFKKSFKFKCFRKLAPLVVAQVKSEEKQKELKLGLLSVKDYKSSVEFFRCVYVYDYVYDYDYGYVYDYVYDYDYGYGYGYKNNIPLTFFSEALLETLIELKSPGCQWLWLCDEI